MSSLEAPLEVCMSPYGDDVLISFKNELTEKSRKRLFFLLDVSGSMSGLLLNLVQHACKVIISASTEDVEISIFTFSHDCTKVTELLQMNNTNKDNFTRIINGLTAGGSTNLISGIDTTLSYIKRIPNTENIDTHCLIFTDGIPDNRNLSDYHTLLDKYLTGDMKINCTVDMFGFGTSLTIEILELIYTKGNGIFGFISDKNMLATVFNNYLANLFCTSIKNIKLSYEVESPDGNLLCNVLNIGNMLSSQERNIIIKLPDSHKITFVSIEYTNLITSQNKIMRYEPEEITQGVSATKYLYHKLRSDLIQTLNNNINNISVLRVLLMTLYRKYQYADSLIEDEYGSVSKLKLLLDDIYSVDLNKGQIEKSIQYYSTWGKFYLLSIIQSHINQLTINFKDESIEEYSGNVSKELVNSLDTLFNGILFITTGQSYGSYGSSYSTTASSYNDRSAGCFSGNCKAVIIRNGTPIVTSLCDIKTGNIVFNGVNSIRINYIIKTPNFKGLMIKYGNLIGTPNHPVLYNRKWTHLKDLTGSIRIEDFEGDIYTFSGIDIKTGLPASSIEIEDIPCATFGHNDLDKDINDPNYSILSSTFWGKTIVTIIEQLIDDNKLEDSMLILNDNYKFIRNDKGWIVDMIIE